jgi:hypothetical protein
VRIFGHRHWIRLPSAQPQSMKRRILIIAGPNGAGKTTFARTYLPNEGGYLNFVNADLIALGLAPFRPEIAAVQAGRITLAEINRLAAEGASFAFETTLSGRTYAPMIPLWAIVGIPRRFDLPEAPIDSPGAVTCKGPRSPRRLFHPFTCHQPAISCRLAEL